MDFTEYDEDNEMVEDSNYTEDLPDVANEDLDNEQGRRSFLENLEDAELFEKYKDGDYSYAMDGADIIDTITEFAFNYIGDNDSWAHIMGKGRYQDSKPNIQITKDGLFIFTWTDENGQIKTHQYVYFYCDNDGIILTDGKTNYYYIYDAYGGYENKLAGSLTIDELEKLEDMDEEKLEEIVEKKANLLTDLAQAYQEAGLDVDINETTGEITLDSTILFEVSKADISSEGKEFLKKFISIYASVVFSEKYENFVSHIMVEGHTDTSGDYDMNLELSQKRADTVKDYCLSEEAGVDVAYIDALTATMKSLGYSYDNPIYNDNGEVDMEASRRVAFRFLINLGS